MPRIVFSVVDFPDALPPSRHTSSPVSDLEVDVLEDVHLAVVRVDALEPEERLGPAVGAHVRSLPVPRYASTTRGSVATASKEPSAIFTPWSSATTRSEIPSTTCMSCSMTRIV